MRRGKPSAAQRELLAMMGGGYRLVRETDGFYIGNRQISKRTIISMLKKRVIKPARDGAFGRSQTYLVAE